LRGATFHGPTSPWADLAFPSVRWALTHHREVAAAPVFAPRSNPPGETGDYL
jgi:hypothetical protein